MANDTKRYGKKYRILKDAATRAWDVISFWTSARDVELDDGTTLQNSFTSLKQTTEEHTASLTDLVTENNATVTNAPGYDSTKKYEKGDIVSYNGSFYSCNTTINNPEAWNSAHWDLITDPIPFKFGIDADGNYGYIKAGADSVTPFSKTSSIYLGSFNGSGTFYLRDYGIKESVWGDLTADNFIVGGGTAAVHSGWYYTEGFHGVAGSFHVSKTYDAHAGTLTVSAHVNCSGEETVSAAAPVYATYVAPQ